MTRAGLATAIAVAMTALGVAAAGAEASPGSARSAIVAMGDSFISGEGGGRYGSSAESGCDRSEMAPVESAPIAVGERLNLACSGARTENVWREVSGGRWHFGEPPQADRLAAVALRDDVRLVVLTVGANDVGFGGLVAECALDWARSSEEDPILCRESAGEDVAAALPAASSGLRKSLREVRVAMARAGYPRSGYRLIVMGYASPLPLGEEIRYPESGWARLTDGGCPVWNADADWVVEEVTPAIAEMMRAAAGSEGAEFLDVQHAFDAHQLCDRRSSRDGSSLLVSEWFRPLALRVAGIRESLHPNAHGQRALGACIALAYAALPGDRACADTPGRSYVDGMRLASLR